ncbi:DUF4192 domain-containing protein [Kineococcus sp. TRM81007]|nr:DUF4192 domain-containing protein [Kineococcus sp. TRM81007]
MLPYRLGFHPRHSLVLVELEDGGAGRPCPLGAVVRVDLPSPAPAPAAAPQEPTRAGRDGAAQAAAEAVACLLRTRARGTAGPVLVVCYDETGTGSGSAPGAAPGLRTGPAGAAAVAAALSGLRDAQVPVVEAVLVAAGRWRSLTCTDARCCPPAGLPVRTPAADRVAAEAVSRGLSAVVDRDAALPERTPLPAQRREAARAARAAAPPARTAVRRKRALAEFEREVARYLPPGAPVLPDARAAGRLLAALEDVPVRDAALLTGAPEHLRAPAVAALVRSRPGTADPAAGDLVHRALRAEPDRTRTAAAAALAVDLARHAPGREGAGAWAVAGWAYWSVGDGVRADACTGAALEADPGHRLAGLVATALRAGLPPRERGAG